MPSLKHPHTYQRVKSRPNIYRCIHPDCSHYEKRELILNKRATCVCGGVFIIDKKSLRLRDPHCATCSKHSTEKTTNQTAVEKVLADKLGPKYAAFFGTED